MSKLDELIKELCPDGVEYKNLKEIAIKIADGMHNLPKTVQRDTGYPIISAQNIHDNTVDFQTQKYVEKKYGWEKLQQAIIRILLDDSRSLDDYCEMADVIWIAALEKSEGVPVRFRKKTLLGLLYYRLEGKDFTGRHNDYENLLWSIACKFFHLDYCNSTYAPLKDEKIIRKLEKYGIHI